MAAPWDRFINAVEQRKQQLDEVLDAYRMFREKLDALPPDLAVEAQQALGQNSSPVGSLTAAKNDLAGKTALECVKIILREKGNEPQHFSAVAKEALRRGYMGRASGNAEEVENRTTNSFWSAMSRDKALESVGKGLYRLQQDGFWPDREFAPQKRGRREQMMEFLHRRGPATRKEILLEAGIPVGTVGVLLKDGPDSPFAKDPEGRWYLREGAKTSTDPAESSD